MEGVEIIGIADGYSGLIKGDYRVMEQREFSGILTLGGTILGTARTPFKDMRKIGDDNIDKVSSMVKNYEKMKLDCLCTLGGNGTHKTANLLAEEGLNVIGLPKTIDNDIWEMCIRDRPVIKAARAPAPSASYGGLRPAPRRAPYPDER